MRVRDDIHGYSGCMCFRRHLEDIHRKLELHRDCDLHVASRQPDELVLPCGRLDRVPLLLLEGHLHHLEVLAILRAAQLYVHFDAFVDPRRDQRHLPVHRRPERGVGHRGGRDGLQRDAKVQRPLCRAHAGRQQGGG